MPSSYPPAASRVSDQRQALSSSAPHLRFGMFPLSLSTRFKFGASFFLFGTLNNVLYVVILSAALDLVDKATTPKGLILFVNIFPALVVKLGWPYFVPGTPRYSHRITSCSALSFLGIIIVAFSKSLSSRLMGISIASFSSGLGEMTYLQLSTTYGTIRTTTNDRDLAGIAVGWFSSGTGGAGLVGSGLWWILRGFGIETGLLICSFLPLMMAGTYFLLLPPLEAFRQVEQARTDYEAIPTLEDDMTPDSNLETDDQVPRASRGAHEASGLTTRDKFELARPLLVPFMLPLFFVYLAEYTINSGVAPTLLYPVPSPSKSPVLSLAIHSLRDYYPLYQLLYQTFVFVSRSSLSILHLPPLPLALLPVPTIFQLVILALTTWEAKSSVFVHLFGEAGATWCTLVLVSLEGLCGGAAYVNCFYRLGAVASENEPDGREEGNKDQVRRQQEKEFKIASVGFADTSGILVASLIATVLEPALCRDQVRRGRTFCTEL
ncbi:amino acid transporter YHC3 [Sporobolomyces koalae]|uniref:amino acid transporter YHC3 n=1 Tax=Sporobolomyces koalae TaxID=500713 RepID=UPI003170615E